MSSDDLKSAWVVGVDVGGTKMAGALTDLSGKVRARQTVTQQNAPADPYDRLACLIESLIVQAPPGERVRGIGLGVAGVTDLAHGAVSLAPSLGWTDFPLAAKLEERFGVPVYLDNDVNAIMIGERWFGAARDARHVLCVAVGTGIGASILMDGQLYRGANEAAGEVGYLITTVDALAGPAGVSSAHGFLELMASGTGIAQRGSERLGFPVSTAEVFRLAGAGDLRAQSVVDEAASHLGLALAGMVSLLNPELLILTGGVMRSHKQLIGRIRTIIDRVVPYAPRIVLSDLREEGGVLGAVGLVLDAARRSFPARDCLAEATNGLARED